MSLELKCEQWAAGKVKIRFSQVKIKKRPTVQKSEAPVESSIGVSCSWFKQDAVGSHWFLCLEEVQVTFLYVNHTYAVFHYSV